jgi:hypothetical protein
MTGADMIVWQAFPDYPIVSDAYASSRKKPINDTLSNDYETGIIINSTHIRFESIRSFISLDPQDTEFILVKNYITL